MSSYLLAFVVSDLDFISNEEFLAEGETLHRIWVRPDSTSKAWYALENSEKVLKALEDYVGFKFELPKIDSAGIPNKHGALQNWGIVMYR
jgi:aminopeptidase N